MATPIVDPTFQPACYVFGYSLPGMAHFGNTRWYPQQAIFGTRPFGWEIPGKNTENDVFQFIYGSKNPKKPYCKNGEWRTSTSSWPVTPQMSMRARGVWAKRVIYYTHGGRQMVRRATPYHMSAKNHLVPWVNKLVESSALWSALSQAAKAQLTADAKRTRQATQGHNYFTKLYIKNDPRWRNYV